MITYKVGLRKDYFSPENRPKEAVGPLMVWVEIIKVTAIDRMSAAMKAWWDVGLRERWRDKMMPHVKHVSLDVDDRQVPGNGGALGRLGPIRVE